MKTKAYSLFFYSLCFIALLLAGCSSEPEADCVSVEADNPGHDQTLIFVDASGSAAQESILAHYESELRRIVQERLDEGKHCAGTDGMAETGDKLSLFPIHSKTISKEGRWDVENETLPPETEVFEEDEKNNINLYNLEIRQFVESIRDKASARVSSIVTNSNFSGATDIWGSLQVIGDEAESSVASVQVVYLSDMFEAVGGSGRRNFESRPPRTLTQARAWAREDVESNLSRHVNLTEERMEALTQVDVRVLPGPLATKDGAPEVQVYWETFFQELGVQSIRYN